MKREKITKKTDLEKDLEAGFKIEKMLEYEKESEKHTNLNEEEISQILEDGKAAIEFLVEKHKRLAYKFSHNFKNKSGTLYSLEDLHQEALGILVKACYSYNPHRNCKFITHAFRILQRDLCRANQHTIKVPASVVDKYQKINIATREWEASASPTLGKYEYIEQQTGLSQWEIESIVSSMGYASSLNWELEGGKYQAMDFLADPKHNTEPEKAHLEAVDKILEYLTDDEKEVIYYEFAIGEPRTQSFEEFKVKYKLTDRSFMRRVADVVKRIRLIAGEVGLDEFY